MSGDRKLTREDLSKDQREVYEAVCRWTTSGSTKPKPKPKQTAYVFKPMNFDVAPATRILTVGGYAGTGKTSLLGVFAAETKLLVAYVTYTGRASSVLHRKLKACDVATTTKSKPHENNEAWNPRWHDPNLGDTYGPAFVGTMHRLLYAPIIHPKTEELLGWHKREKLDRHYGLIVVDEASMVGDEMLEDLQGHGVSILAVGDHGQLPPVLASGELMKDPNLRLEKIHRQAEKNPIIALSKIIRETGRLDYALDDGKHIRFSQKMAISKVLKKAYKRLPPLEVGLMCWTNRMRIKLNGAARDALKLKGVPPKGEVVLCLKNRAPVYNGMRGVLTSDAKVDGNIPWILHTEVEFPDEGIPPDEIKMCAATFNRERMFQTITEMQAMGIAVEKFSDAGWPFDFGYAMTVHKAQGSQFKHAIFYLDRAVTPDDEEWRRFAYTAVTRASERLTVLT